jgi:hypothetical protein
MQDVSTARDSRRPPGIVQQVRGSKGQPVAGLADGLADLALHRRSAQTAADAKAVGERRPDHMLGNEAAGSSDEDEVIVGHGCLLLGSR